MTDNSNQNSQVPNVNPAQHSLEVFEVPIIDMGPAVVSPAERGDDDTTLKRIKKKTAPTIKQRMAAKEIIANGGNVGAAMRKVGYSPSMVDNPSKLTRSDGFRALADEIGLTDEFLFKLLHQDLKKKAGNRVRELELGFKVRNIIGSKEDNETPVFVPIQIIVSPLDERPDNNTTGN